MEALWNNPLLESFPSMNPEFTHVLKDLDMLCEFALRVWRRNVAKDFLRWAKATDLGDKEMEVKKSGRLL